jgi:hypothetical protein
MVVVVQNIDRAENKKMQQTQQTPDSSVSYEYDRHAHAMCDALARALCVSKVIVRHVYETRLFPRAEAFASMDDVRDALVRALREYEAEAEACERALRAQRLAELHRQQKAASKRAAERRPLPRVFACDARRRHAL